MNHLPTLYVATGNAHKLKEINALLGADVRCVSMQSLGELPELIEDEDTFEGNALAKATQLAEWMMAQGVGESPWMTLADDSGLEVDALGGQPGVKSARYASDETGSAGNAPDEANNAKVLRLMQGVPAQERTARFRCSLALYQPPVPGQSARSWRFDGTCEGILRDALVGGHGFGYDPMFQPEGHDQTFGELGAAIKDQISHRSRALQLLRQFLQTFDPATDPGPA